MTTTFQWVPKTSTHKKKLPIDMFSYVFMTHFLVKFLWPFFFKLT